jgi:hypothetical protein
MSACRISKLGSDQEIRQPRRSIGALLEALSIPRTSSGLA